MKLYFSHEGINRSAHLRNNLDFLKLAKQDPQSRFIAFTQENPLFLCPTDLSPELLLLSYEQIPPQTTAHFLGLHNGISYFAVDLVHPYPLSKALSLRAAAQYCSDDQAGLLAYAQSLMHWSRHFTFCPQCAQKLKLSPGGDFKTCSSCSKEYYPRINPVVIMVVEAQTDNGPVALLGRQARHPKGMYSCLAGFIEVGESIESAVIRETLEETGIQVDEQSIEILFNQPWPWPSQLMIGCFAKALSLQDPVPAPDELESAHWFTKEEIRKSCLGTSSVLTIPPPLTIAHQLLKRWSSYSDETLSKETL